MLSAGALSYEGRSSSAHTPATTENTTARRCWSSGRSSPVSQTASAPIQGTRIVNPINQSVMALPSKLRQVAQIERAAHPLDLDGERQPDHRDDRIRHD